MDKHFETNVLVTLFAHLSLIIYSVIGLGVAHAMGWI